MSPLVKNGKFIVCFGDGGQLKTYLTLGRSESLLISIELVQ